MFNSVSFLDDYRILSHIFYPRNVIGGESSVGREIVSFWMENGVKIDGIMYLAGVSAPNILFFHGNGEIAYDYDDIGPVYNDLGINFLVVDYRGYGTSSGQPTYSGMFADANRIFAGFCSLIKERGMGGNVFVMGRSLGSAPAIELASMYRDVIAGLIVESGFANTYNLLKRLGVDPRLLDPLKEDLVSNMEKIKKVLVPILVIHGELDEIIPLSDGLDLCKGAASKDKNLIVIPRANHNTLFLRGPELYFRSVANFIRRLSNQDRY